MHSAHVDAEDLSSAWLLTVREALQSPDKRLFHTVTRIEDSTIERDDIRSAVDQTLSSWRKPSIETVAGTIFPTQTANSSANHEELASRYLSMYTRLRKYNGNQRGTYFGRIVAYPSPSGEHNQLKKVITNLQTELSSPGAMSTRYELGIAAVDDLASANAIIYAPEKDNYSRGFPCLSFCSFQIDGDRLHMLAQYRYEYLIEKGYGNYLGLARLLAYIAAQVNLLPGQLTIITARCKIDSSQKLLDAHLRDLTA